MHLLGWDSPAQGALSWGHHAWSGGSCLPVAGRGNSSAPTVGFCTIQGAGLRDWAPSYRQPSKCEPRAWAGLERLAPNTRL